MSVFEEMARQLRLRPPVFKHKDVRAALSEAADVNSSRMRAISEALRRPIILPDVEFEGFDRMFVIPDQIKRDIARALNSVLVPPEHKHHYVIDHSDRLYHYYECDICHDDARVAKHIVKAITTKHPEYGRVIFSDLRIDENNGN